MKTLKTLGSTKFWMILSAMLLVFILAAGILLIALNPYRTTQETISDQQSSVVQQEPSQDTGFEATKDRVNQVNGNYGQGVKDSYTGDSSTMESMMKQRMFFSGLKSIMIVILLAVVVVVVIVKGFNLTLFKKKAGAVDAGESEISEEEHKSAPAAVAEKSPKKKTTHAPTPKPKSATEQENKTGNTPARDADEQEVADACQLP